MIEQEKEEPKIKIQTRLLKGSINPVSARDKTDIGEAKSKEA